MGKPSTNGNSPTHNADDLKEKYEHLQDGFHNLWDTVDELATAVERLEDEIDQEREQRRELEARVDQLDARTDLLRLVEEADSLTPKQRSTILIQHLKREAEQARSREKDAKASVNREEAERALQFPNLHRTTNLHRYGASGRSRRQ